LELSKKVLGEEHSGTLSSMGELGIALMQQGKFVEAEELFRKTLELQGKTLGKKHKDTLASMNNLAWGLEYQGKNAQAEEMYRETLVLMEKVLGLDDKGTLVFRRNLERVIAKIESEGTPNPPVTPMESNGAGDSA